MTDRSELLKLDSQLCFAFYAASRALTRLYRDFLDPLGITYPQFLVLNVLFECHEANVSQIGSKLMLDSGTLTPLLRRLEAMNLVNRIRGDYDARTVQVTLTEKADGLRQHLLEASSTVHSRLGLPNTEIENLRNLIMGLVSKVTDDDANAQSMPARAPPSSN